MSPPSAPGSQPPQIVHATCIALRGRGLLITGASGSGKSALALQLMALGAQLVADDQVILEAGPGGVTAIVPDPISGLIEARGIGILTATPAGPVRLGLAVDLDHAESERLPPRRETRLLGQSVPLLYRVDASHFAASLIQFLAHGRQHDP